MTNRKVAKAMSRNIQIFECKDDGSFGPMVARYFEIGDGAIYATIIKKEWYFFNGAEGAEYLWHKPGPMGCMFCENAVRDQKMVHISEESFEAKTGVGYLDSARQLMRSPDPSSSLSK